MILQPLLPHFSGITTSVYTAALKLDTCLIYSCITRQLSFIYIITLVLLIYIDFVSMCFSLFQTLSLHITLSPTACFISLSRVYTPLGIIQYVAPRLPLRSQCKVTSSVFSCAVSNPLSKPTSRRCPVICLRNQASKRRELYTLSPESAQWYLHGRYGEVGRGREGGRSVQGGREGARWSEQRGDATNYSLVPVRRKVLC